LEREGAKRTKIAKREGREPWGFLRSHRFVRCDGAGRRGTCGLSRASGQSLEHEGAKRTKIAKREGREPWGLLRRDRFVRCEGWRAICGFSVHPSALQPHITLNVTLSGSNSSTRPSMSR
jgi:hypothetical protein